MIEWPEISTTKNDWIDEKASGDYDDVLSQRWMDNMVWKCGSLFQPLIQYN